MALLDPEGTPRVHLTLYLRDGEPWRILVDGRDGRFSPLQRFLLLHLARAVPEAVHREDLLEALAVAPTGLYKLVHATRRRLGDPELLEHVGSCVNHDGKPRGYAGYRLRGVSLEWRAP